MVQNLFSLATQLAPKDGPQFDETPCIIVQTYSTLELLRNPHQAMKLRNIIRYLAALAVCDIQTLFTVFRRRLTSFSPMLGDLLKCFELGPKQNPDHALTANPRQKKGIKWEPPKHQEYGRNIMGMYLP